MHRNVMEDFFYNHTISISWIVWITIFINSEQNQEKQAEIMKWLQWLYSVTVNLKFAM